MCQVATCGDGQRRLDLSEGEAGYEARDDANTVDEDACLSNCRIARCGDGGSASTWTRAMRYEACDDANEEPGDSCKTTAASTSAATAWC